MGSALACRDRIMIEAAAGEGSEQDQEKIAEMAALIGCDVDQEATAALVQRYVLRF